MVATENPQVTFLQNPGQWPFKGFCPVRRNAVRDSGGLPQLGVVCLWPACPAANQPAEVVPIVFEALLHDVLEDDSGQVLARAPQHKYPTLAALVAAGWEVD